MTSVEDIAVVEAPPAHAAVGDRLRAAREARGLSVADIAQTLKFSNRQVELIEGNAWSELPGQTFIRGCVRNYAKMLQLDPVALIRDLEAENLPKAPVLSVPGSTHATLPVPGRSGGLDRLAVFGGLLLVVLAIGAYFLVPEELWRGRGKGPEAPSAAANPATAPTPAVPVAPVAPTAAPPAAVNAPPATVEAMPSTAAAGAHVAAPNAANAVLRFQFEQSSWVEVRDSNGLLLHSQNNAAGTTQEVVGPLPLSVIVGDARRVRMVYNEKPVDLQPFTNPQSNVARLNIE
jgi:cytoskeleton protein RodZ